MYAVSPLDESRILVRPRNGNDIRIKGDGFFYCIIIAMHLVIHRQYDNMIFIEPQFFMLNKRKLLQDNYSGNDKKNRNHELKNNKRFSQSAAGSRKAKSGF